MIRKNILVVEDEIMILNNICIILQINGYTCVKANNGLEALKVLENFKPDLILSDVMMPEMNGFELLQKIKANEELKTIPFCFLSARADIKDIDNGIDIGATAYITKPFLAKDLLENVSKFLQ